jgi:hypothetical protein
VLIFRVATGDVFDKISFLRTSATTLRKWSSATALLVFVALPLRVGSNQNHVDLTSSASIGSHNRTVATHRTRYNRVGVDALPAQATRVQRRLSPARGQRHSRCLQPSKMNTWNRRKTRRHEVSTWPGREFSAERRRKEKSLTRNGPRSHRASLRRAPAPVGDSASDIRMGFMFGLRKTAMTS